MPQILNHYPKNELKPSGIEWLGDIPEHWEAKKLKYVAQINPSKKNYEFSKDADDEIVFLPMERVTEDGVFDQSLRKPINSVSSGFTYFERGDVIIAKITPCFENGKGALLVNLDTTFGFGSTEFHTLRASTVLDTRFLFLVSKSGLFRKIGEAFMTGAAGQKRVSTDFVENFKLGFPPLSEQQAIASYLDGKCGEIDDLIANKQRIIALLQEERAAMINQAVTRGLNPKAKLKPSGVEWLGDVPEHWEVKRMKHLGMIRYGLGEPPEYVDDGLPFIRATDINHGKIDTRLVKRVAPDDIPWHRRPLLELNEILVVRSGAYTGDSAIVSNEIAGCVAGYDMILTIQKASPEFLAWVLLSRYMLIGQIYLERMRAAQPHLNAEELGAFFVLLPSLSEQQEIVEYIDQETARIDEILSRTKREIELLQEYRTALISEVVTGKVRVPQEVNEEKPTQKSGRNATIRRAVLAAEVVHRFHTHQTFGRVKLMKCLYLLENHLQIKELDMEWSRQLAGPYSPKGIGSVEKVMNKNQWFGLQKTTGNSIRYFRLSKSGGHKKYFPAWFGDRQSEIDQLLDLLSPLNMDQCEITATLYGVWNDLIIQNESITDDRIVDEVRNHWHDTKKRFEPERLKKALGWMRKKNIVPTGWGKPLMIPDKKKQK